MSASTTDSHLSFSPVLHSLFLFCIMLVFKMFVHFYVFFLLVFFSGTNVVFVFVANVCIDDVQKGHSIGRKKRTKARERERGKIILILCLMHIFLCILFVHMNIDVFVSVHLNVSEMSLNADVGCVLTVDVVSVPFMKTASFITLVVYAVLAEIYIEREID